MIWVEELISWNEPSIDLKYELLVVNAPTDAKLLLQVHEHVRENVELVDVLAICLRHNFSIDFDGHDFAASVVSGHDLHSRSEDENSPVHSTLNKYVRWIISKKESEHLHE